MLPREAGSWVSQALSKYVNPHSPPRPLVQLARSPLSPASLIPVSRSFLLSLRDPDLTPAGVTIPGLELVTQAHITPGLSGGQYQDHGQALGRY